MNGYKILIIIDSLEKRVSDKTEDQISAVIISMLPQIQKIAGNIRALSKEEPDECGAQVVQQLEQTQNLLQKGPALKKTFKARNFTIKQWDKKLPETLLLGDYVSCCLATNGTSFHAMVQRRLDDAMLMHVATEDTTDKPVALIWLYLAESESGELILMANFFEVNVKYGLDKNLRLSLLEGLLRFTEKYCTDNPSIKGFYMNQLSYGLNQDDIKSFPVVSLELKDKLGGAFLPSNRSNGLDSISMGKQKTSEVYYLQSITNSEFHQFSAEMLQHHPMYKEGMQETDRKPVSLYVQLIVN